MKNVARWLFRFVAFVLFIGLAFYLLLMCYQPESLAADSVSASRLKAPVYKVGSEVISITDTSRPADDLPTRQLNGKVWYPLDGQGQQLEGERPLIVYAHGFNETHSGSSFITQYLVTKGYIVAAIDFPLSNRGAHNKPTVTDVINQPADLSFLLDYLLIQNQQKGSNLYQKINPEKIGLAGMSLGGLTANLMAYHKDLKDDRLAAVVVLAGPTQMLSAQFFKTRPKLPYLYIGGTVDEIVDYPNNAAPLIEKNPNSWLLTINGGSHLGFVDKGKYLSFTKNVDHWGCQAMRAYFPEVASRNNTMMQEIDDEQLAAGMVNDSFSSPCSTIKGDGINPVYQHWITQLAVEAFFDFQLRDSKPAKDFFHGAMLQEHPVLSLSVPAE